MILLKLHSDYVTGNERHWLIVYLNANTLTTKTESKNKSLYFNNHTDTALPLLTLIDIYWSTSSPTLSEYNISLINETLLTSSSSLQLPWCYLLHQSARPLIGPIHHELVEEILGAGRGEEEARMSYLKVSPSLARIRSRSRIMNSPLRPFNLSVYSWVTDSKHIIPR